MKMFANSTERHDERHIAGSLLLQRRNSKFAPDFAFSGGVAFSRNSVEETLSNFVLLGSRELSGGTFFSGFVNCEPERVEDGDIWFASDLAKDKSDSNSHFRCVVDYARKRKRALVVFNHWFATERYDRFASFFARAGITVVQVPLPYHFERAEEDGKSQFRAFSANLGETVFAVRQAVLDGRKVVSWLFEEGYEEVSVAGMCLGGLVAGLVAANDTRVSKYISVVSAGSMADAVWTGDTLVPIKEKISKILDLDGYRMAMAIISLEAHAEKLAKVDSMFVIGVNDRVVRPEVTMGLFPELDVYGGDPRVLKVQAGHSSLGIFPHNLNVAWKVLNFLKET